MARNGKTNASAPIPKSEGITRISVAGFKSIRDEQSIEIRPLTILAGANSSGKSSIMQPLLLMKQTLEASFDSGPLLLNGPNANFTSSDQFLARRGTSVCEFSYKTDTHALSTTYQSISSLEIIRMTASDRVGELSLTPTMSHGDVQKALEDYYGFRMGEYLDYDLTIFRNRCFLGVWLNRKEKIEKILPRDQVVSDIIDPIRDSIQTAIHVPGIRGDVKSPYPMASVDRNFPGVFDSYVGAAIDNWQKNHDERLASLLHDMRTIKLITSLEARRVNDVSIELFVSRLPNAAHDTEDKVNIAQVGLGVPVTLSAVTALHAATSGQLVYIEQPELHLHPHAQVAMAKVLADAAIRGVRVVIETHSSLLLRGVQTLVAEGKLDQSLVKLHWFTRDDEGNTQVDSADLTKAGAFGKWPQDFGDVDLEAQGRYLDAAGKQLLRSA